MVRSHRVAAAAHGVDREGQERGKQGCAGQNGHLQLVVADNMVDPESQQLRTKMSANAETTTNASRRREERSSTCHTTQSNHGSRAQPRGRRCQLKQQQQQQQNRYGKQANKQKKAKLTGKQGTRSRRSKLKYHAARVSVIDLLGCFPYISNPGLPCVADTALFTLSRGPTDFPLQVPKGISATFLRTNSTPMGSPGSCSSSPSR